MNKNAAFSVLVAFTAIALLVIWIRHDFGPSTAFMVVGGLALLAAAVIGYLLSMANTRSTAQTFVNIMESVERGNIEQFRTLRSIKDGSAKQQPQTIQSEWAQLPPPPTWTPAPQRMLSMVDDDGDGMRVDIER
jgi:hypothetical protein